jgi:hypothetical protein
MDKLGVRNISNGVWGIYTRHGFPVAFLNDGTISLSGFGFSDDMTIRAISVLGGINFGAI